ncbi:MAG: cytochrome c [Hyphomicrobiaceae bacterium]
MSYSVFAADEPSKAPAASAEAVQAPAAVPATDKVAGSAASPAPADGAAMKPLDRVKAAAKGTLKNPYTDKPDAIAEGSKKWFAFSCNGCHGGGGGGGMCPPVTNEVWVYGSDDDTMFRLIVQGTQDLKKEGYVRKGTEGVVGPMPAFGELIESEDDVWKVIAFIRTLYKGSPTRRNW